MASPNVFASPPTESSLRKSHFFHSSSPDLPSVHDIVSQNLKPPPFKPSIQRAARASESTKATETRSDLVVIAPRAGLGVPKEDDDDKSIQIEDSSVVEVAADAVPDVFKDREKKRVLRATPNVKHDACSAQDQQPWKKFLLKDDLNEQELNEKSKGTDRQTLPAHDCTGIINPVETDAEPIPKIPRQPAQTKRDDSKESLYLEPAMTRRLDWTPPTSKNVIALDSDSPLSNASRPSQAASSKAQSFEQLLDSYMCTGTMRLDASVNPDEDSGFFKKRKLIEMVADKTPKVTPIIPQQAPEKAPEKQKAPKKKPRTITELATAAYRAPSLGESVAITRSRDSVNNMREKVNEEGEKGKKAAAKPRKRALKKKKLPSPPKPVLLPPTEALEEVANQDFVFGTSSQLAAEQSPTFLRYLQVAMKESNELDIIDLEASPTRRSGEVTGQRPKLWHAGARDEDGELFDLEVSEMAYAPSRKMHASPEENDPFGYIQDGENSPIVVVEPDDDGVKVMETDDPFDTSSEDLTSFGLQPISVIDCEEHADNEKPKSCEPLMKPPPSHQPGMAQMRVETSNKLNDSAPNEIVNDQHPQQPLYDLYTDAQLAKEVTSYGFKTIKSRKAKIALLEQCWQSKVRSMGVGAGTSAGFATKAGPCSENLEPSIPPVKRRRGRPRKNSIGTSAPHEPPPSAQPRESPVRARAKLKATSAPIPVTGLKAKRGRPTKKTGAKPPTCSTQTTTHIPVEIPDSESDEESGESRASRGSTCSPPPPVDFSMSLDEGPSSLGLEDLGDTYSSSVFAYITKAITSAPRSTDATNPSWHEKILLYDSIILEDLAAWLNDGQLRRVGTDDEVSVGELKKWCELKSICCLMRVNLRGKERKRY